ncbi:hypothetical protein M404DRAFT_1009138 [Pisolithus tinctorius Marx 270]|uniref:Uncharacterized protein n=1 Tax=Pisolithus tinctorius Marx 270 TaxID=870435 RepID=A0A0C3MW75_PISTI|nr:hypothetical protein M404DRAFT_1009138 [Pisolithus tinctorius Marx 270]
MHQLTIYSKVGDNALQFVTHGRASSMAYQITEPQCHFDKFWRVRTMQDLLKQSSTEVCSCLMEDLFLTSEAVRNSSQNCEGLSSQRYIFNSSSLQT